MKFDFKQKKFNTNNLNESLQLAKLALLVYKSPLEVEQTLKKSFQAIKAYCENNSDDMQYALAKFDGGLILMFKGTDATEIKDWLVNIKTKKINGPWNARVHRGFYTALLTLWPGLLEKIEDFQDSMDEPLWITGHSLGGALSVLAGARLIEQKRQVSAVYTFGAPRVGDKDFCRVFNKYIPHALRFVHNEDIVPRVPKFAYDHAGVKCYFTADKKMIFNPPFHLTMIDWMNEINFRSMKVTNQDIKRHPGGILDHGMQNYCMCVELNCSSDISKNRKENNFLKYINT